MLNRAWATSPRAANPDLQGAARAWYSRLFNLDKGLQALPPAYNVFTLKARRDRAFAIVALGRLDAPFLAAVIAPVNGGPKETVRLQVDSLEQAITLLTDAYDTRSLTTGVPLRTIDLREENVRQILQDAGPAL